MNSIQPPSTQAEFDAADQHLRTKGLIAFVDLEKIAINAANSSESLTLYDASGNCINAYMSSHPLFKDSWTNLTLAEKWVFIHDMHYGVEESCRMAYNRPL